MRVMIRQAVEASARAISEGEPLPPVEDRRVAQLDLDDLYRVEKPRLMRQLSRRLPIDRAEDIVQQVFTRVLLRKQGKAPDIVCPAAYLYEAARNAVRDDARASSRARFQPIDEDTANVASDPLCMLEARDRLARVEKALKRLKPLAREIFLARRVDGYSYDEIAQRTGLSVRGVEKQMSRAIKLLGHHLHGHD